MIIEEISFEQFYNLLATSQGTWTVNLSREMMPLYTMGRDPHPNPTGKRGLAAVNDKQPDIVYVLALPNSFQKPNA